MGWATNYIAQLQEGKTISFRPRGNSMTGIIDDGDLVTVEPWDPSRFALTKGQVVLCKVGGSQFLHKVSAVRSNQVQISNNHGHINGWTSLDKVYGVVIHITA